FLKLGVTSFGGPIAHPRLSTASVRKYPRCAIGPPKEVTPSLRKTRNTSQAEPRAPGGATTESLILGFLPGGSRDTSGSDLPSRPREASGLHRGTKHQLERIRWDVDLKLDPPLTCG